MLSQVHSHRVLDNRITQSLLALRNRDHPQGKHRSHRDRVHVLDRRLQCTRNVTGQSIVLYSRLHLVVLDISKVNVLVIALNILLLLTEYKLHDIQVSFKTVVYSIKLKLEFSMLNRLR
ncbi:hypothetical protein CBS147317_7184 [Penicillium roqueforti]|nr:hypothetical protein CBS147372_5472 [Penicillium roqueforti]KAI3151629.1 hypothetical protein CBS147317_7184 [Penicillium roqueforti]